MNFSATKNWLLLLACLPLVSQAKDYKAAEVYTSQQVLYGKWVVRMKAAKGSGIISNFFVYKNGSEQSGTFWEEIDVEVFGKGNASQWQSNIITGLGSRISSEQVHSGPAFADGFNTFTLEWAPSHVRWLVNGQQVRRSTGSQVNAVSNPASFRFNIWPPNIPSWVGAFDTNRLPQAMFVDYVEYHRWNGAGFQLTWRDDFNSFNAARWVKANHTFAQNSADFVPTNAVIHDGQLVLALTRAGQEGYTPASDADDADNDPDTSNPDAPDPDFPAPEPPAPVAPMVNLLLDETSN